MANPASCASCLEVADAEFFVTNRLGVPWPFEQSTVALCVPCFINTGIQMGQALQAALAEMEAAQEPGLLEQVEADEGKVTVVAATSKSRRKAKEAAPETGLEPALPPETEAADD